MGGLVGRQQHTVLLLQGNEGPAGFGSCDLHPAVLRLGAAHHHGAVGGRGAGEVHLGVGEAVSVGGRRRRRRGGGGARHVLPDPARGLVQVWLHLHPLLLAPDVVHEHLVVARPPAAAAAPPSPHGQSQFGLVHGGPLRVPLGASQVDVPQLAVRQGLRALVRPAPVRGHPVPGGGVLREAGAVQQCLRAVAAPGAGAVRAAALVRGGALLSQGDHVRHVQTAGPLQSAAPRWVGSVVGASAR